MVESNTYETHIHATNQEDINDLLADGYNVDDDIIPDPDKKTSTKSDTYQPVYI